MTLDVDMLDFWSAERLCRDRATTRPFLRYLQGRYPEFEADLGLADVVDYALGFSDRKPQEQGLTPNDRFWLRSIVAIKEFDPGQGSSRPRQLGIEADFLQSIRVAEQWSLLNAVAMFLLRRIRPRRSVAVVLMATDEGVSLLEWVAHYRAIGVEMIFIYTNENSDGSEVLLEALGQFDDIRIIFNKSGNTTNVQTKVLQHSVFCLPALRDFRWALYVDADEFLIPSEAHDFRLAGLIEQVEQRHERAAAVLFPWHWRLYERRLDRERDPLLSSFPYAVPHTLYKSLVAVPLMTSMADVHFPRFQPGAFVVDSALNILEGEVFWADFAKPQDGGRIEHFWGRSFAEYLIKQKRSAVFQVEPRAYDLFFGWTAPYQDQYYDPIPRRVIERTEANIAALLRHPTIAAAERTIVARFDAHMAAVAGDDAIVAIFDEGRNRVAPTMAPPRGKPPSPAGLEEISELIVMDRAWRFGRGDGSTIAYDVRFKRFGHVIGHDNDNEFGWIFQDGRFEFQTEDGATTCRFDRVYRTTDGRLVMEGRLAGSTIVHVLEEMRMIARLGAPNAAPRVAMLVRTHLVNDKLFDLLDMLNQSRRFDLFVCADETGETLDCGGYTKLSHTVDQCRDFDLSTDHARILWLCGDYPLYFARSQIPDYDYYIMIEYDVDLVRRSPLFLEGLISRLQPPNGPAYDFITAALGPANPDWGWHRNASRSFSKVYETGIFAFVAASGRALDHLYAKRKEEAAAVTRGDDLIHCEAFCGSALMAAGYHCASINMLVEGAIRTESFHPPVLDFETTQYLLDHYRTADPRVEMVHPVFDIDAYLEREYAKSLHRDDVDAFAARLVDLARSDVAPELIDDYMAMVVEQRKRKRQGAA